MHDTIYESGNVPNEFRPIFEELVKEFGAQYEIWRGDENFGIFFRAGIKNTKTNVVVSITLSGPQGKRKSLLNPAEIQKIHNHFDTGIQKNLNL